jgi:hypothetical protein
MCLSKKKILKASFMEPLAQKSSNLHESFLTFYKNNGPQGRLEAQQATQFY